MVTSEVNDSTHQGGDKLAASISCTWVTGLLAQEMPNVHGHTQGCS
jgi:hypothetical protein